MQCTLSVCILYVRICSECVENKFILYIVYSVYAFSLRATVIKAKTTSRWGTAKSIL